MLSRGKSKIRFILIAVMVTVVALTIPVFRSRALAKIFSKNQHPNTMSQQEEQRLNDLASARWAGLAAQYEATVIGQQEEQRLNDLASARWAGLAAQYQALAMSQQREEQRLNDLASARWTGLAAQYQARNSNK